MADKITATELKSHKNDFVIIDVRDLISWLKIQPIWNE